MFVSLSEQIVLQNVPLQRFPTQIPNVIFCKKKKKKKKKFFVYLSDFSFSISWFSSGFLCLNYTFIHMLPSRGAKKVGNSNFQLRKSATKFSVHTVGMTMDITGSSHPFKSTVVSVKQQL